MQHCAASFCQSVLQLIRDTGLLNDMFSLILAFYCRYVSVAGLCVQCLPGGSVDFFKNVRCMRN